MSAIHWIDGKGCLRAGGGTKSPTGAFLIWEHMMELDEKCIKNDGYSFRPNCSIADLDARFEREEKEAQHGQQT